MRSLAINLMALSVTGLGIWAFAQYVDKGTVQSVITVQTGSPQLQTPLTNVTVFPDAKVVASSGLHGVPGVNPAQVFQPQAPDVLTTLSMKQRNDELRASLLALQQQLKQDPNSVDGILAMLSAETDPEMMMLLAELIANNPNPETCKKVRDAALALLKSNHTGLRSAGLIILADVAEVRTDLIDLVASVSREDDSDEVRLAAIHALGKWLERGPELLEPITKKLAETLNASDNSLVRANAIQAIALHESLALPSPVVLAMAEALGTDSSPQNRQLAAMALGGTVGESRAAALIQLEDAYAAEPDLETRRRIMMHIIRAAKDESIAVLARLPGEDPVLARDLSDYQEIIGAGVTDPAEIYNQKTQRNYARGEQPKLGSGPAGHSCANH